MVAPLIAEANDYQIAVLRKKANATRAKAVQSGQTTKSTENLFYQVAVTNRAFKESPALKVKYVLFVERQEIGEKPGSEQIEKVRGDGSIAVLKPQGKATLDTSEVTLREQSLTGNWYYSDGGRIKAKDSLTGIWIKLYDGDVEVGEYVNPTTLQGKHKWE